MAATPLVGWTTLSQSKITKGTRHRYHCKITPCTPVRRTPSCYLIGDSQGNVRDGCARRHVSFLLLLLLLASLVPAPRCDLSSVSLIPLSSSFSTATRYCTEPRPFAVQSFPSAPEYPSHVEASSRSDRHLVRKTPQERRRCR